MPALDHERTGNATTLHDLGREWAIVLADGRYLANVATPTALAFFNTNGELVDPQLLKKLHQPAQVRATLQRSAPSGCPF